MQFVESVRLALATIRVQKLKSFFTLIGVMISVMFLIAVVSIVQGMSIYVEQDFAGKFLGINTFNLRPFPDIQTGNVTDEEWKEWQRRPKITVADAMAVKAALPEDARWAMHDVRWLNVSSAYRPEGVQVLAEAATPEYFKIKDLGVTEGRLFDDQEDALGADVIVIGDAIAHDYFPNLDPLGRELKVGRFPFRVIGVLTHQGTVFGLNLDQQVIAPFHSEMSKLTGARQALYGVVVQAPTPAQFQPLEELVREVMRKRHQLRPAEADNFVLESSASALSQWETIKKYLVLAGIVLPAIGLIVGAIVIMNIMLVAVAERTREIGIRKSLGARRRDILSQFLVESATLSSVGALLGVGLGITMAKVVALVSPLPAAVAPWSIVLSVAIGAGVGIVAGAYPASRASRLDPILAIRAE
ncbi:MAG: ABC transporter permease [Gemmatimonadota bacterium]|nr:ABC transporter permease [Gemmatimonadota bacterium]MDE3173037.1 ABC transporter permease [Gemmatimonadota bacterium]MDE3215110.1 ABC transporter permease [Gemmatimonadota bacterium]